MLKKLNVCEQNAGQNNNIELGNSPSKMWWISSSLEWQ